MRESRGAEVLEARHLLRAAPDLTAEIASERWREINILLRAPLLLESDLNGGTPYPAILRLARCIVAAERGLFYLWDEPKRHLKVACGFGFAPRIPERLRSVNLMAAAAIRRRKPVLVVRVDDAVHARELQLLGGPSCLTVPILRQGASWGAMQVVRREPFREEDGILLWNYALILEGVLPRLIGSGRPTRPSFASIPASTPGPGSGR